MLRSLLISFAALGAVTWLAGCGCNPDPYFEGEGPDVDAIVPAWQNGNLGGEHVLGLVEDIDDLSDEEQELVEPYIVSIQGAFDETDCGSPAVQFGSRAVTVLAVRSDVIQVLAPPGPVRGGRVDVTVTCENGATQLSDAYDYVFGDVRDATGYVGGVLAEFDDEDGDGQPDDPDDVRRIQRLGELYENEYASFTLFYGAAPFLNQPEPVGYGFFFNQPAPRAANFYGGTAGLVYAGATAGDTDLLDVPPQRPQIAFEVPEQGDRIRGGDEVWFYRTRNTPAFDEPLTDFAQKYPTRADAPDPCNPLKDGTAPEIGQPEQFNRHGVWMGVPFDDDEGIQRVRFLRIGNDAGRYCEPYLGCSPTPTECGDGDADFLNNTRLPLGFGDRWLEPETPSIESLRDEYPHAAPELLAYLECVEEGGTEDACLDGLGIMLDSGVYDDVFLCRSLDEADEFPWFRGDDPGGTFDDGMCLILETLGPIEITEGATYVDIPEVARGKWTLDEDNNFYDGFGARYAGVGENVMPRGEPIHIAYEQGFYRGDFVPAKNLSYDDDGNLETDDRGEVLLTVPDAVPYPMGFLCRNADDELDARPECNEGDAVVARFDDAPYVEIPPLDIGTFIDAVTQGETLTDQESWDYREFLGLQTALEPVLLPEPGEEALEWRFPLPGGVGGSEPLDGGGWDDTYYVVTLEVRDLERASGLDNDAAWRASAFAFAGDDEIVMPAATLATLPEIADVFRPDTEDQKGSQYLGIIRMQAHRTARWNLSGENGEFRDSNGNAIFDVNTEWLWYFQNQHSCFDSIDNDGDGLCDAPNSQGIGQCTDENGQRLDPDPACTIEGALYETADCDDGEDNDEDGLIDAEDPDCLDGDGNHDRNDVTEGATCDDEIDNDGDGWVDTDDPGCGGDDEGASEGGFDFVSDCTDGIDNDGDGFVDVRDGGCETAEDDELGDTCTDGIDNNGDGWIDADDITCRPGSPFDGNEVEYTTGEGSEFPCSNVAFQAGDYIPVDDDEDGLANADDPECAYGWDPSGEDGAPDECHDRVDNDGDGWIDDLDAQCSLDPSTEEEGLAGGSCENGEDDDGDGWIDILDPECHSAEDNELFPTSELQCNNGVDDDEDGDVDSADADCPTGKDNHEEQ